MDIGDTMYQFILDYHFTNHKLTIIMLTCVISIPQVCKLYALYTPPYVCIIIIIQVAWMSILKQVVL